MELRHLRYFTAVAKHLSFSKAAEELHISQPPLSRQIQELEREIGTPLFDRKAKRTALTEAGKYLQGEAERILESVELAARKAREIGEGEGSVLRVGAVGFLMYSAFPPLLEFVRERESGLKLEITSMPTDAQEKAIHSGALDIGFVRSWQRDESLAFEPLAEEHLAIIFPSGSLKDAAPRRCIESLASSSFVALSPESGPVLAATIRSILEDYGCSPNVGYVCSDAYSVLRLVGAGLGWSIVPDPLFEGDPIAGVGLVELPQTIGIGLCYGKDELSENERKFIDLAKAFFASWGRSLGQNYSRPASDLGA
jgi:Transcriptional regulator